MKKNLLEIALRATLVAIIVGDAINQKVKVV